MAATGTIALDTLLANCSCAQLQVAHATSLDLDPNSAGPSSPTSPPSPHPTPPHGSIHAVSFGRQPHKPLLLFLHGVPEHWYCWRRELAAFRNEYDVVAIDLRGFGLSSKPVVSCRGRRGMALGRGLWVSLWIPGPLVVWTRPVGCIRPSVYASREEGLSCYWGAEANGAQRW